MNDISYWLLFLTAAVLLNISPGPDMLFLISRTVSYGRRVGLASVLGLGTGALIHTVFVSLGISVIISASLLAFNIIKYLGAAYLLYLGLQAFFAGGLQLKDTGRAAKTPSLWEAYYQAVLIDVFNPKVAIFFMAFLPQFYRHNTTPKMFQFLALGLIIILIGLLVESLVVLASVKLSAKLQESTLFIGIIDKLYGAVLIGLGLRLALEKQ